MEYIRLAHKSKQPNAPGWRTQPGLTEEEATDWIKRGGNLGLRLQPGELVLDIDPRNGGNESAKQFEADFGICLDDTRTTLTPTGGRHHFFLIPKDAKIRKPKNRYPGIDFKRVGGFVVAPESIHPDGGMYLDDSNLTMLPLPAAALEAFTVKPYSGGIPENGEYWTEEDLAKALELLDPHDFADDAAWFELACACHEITRGAGEAAFLDWSAGDARYAGCVEANRARWRSLKAGQPGNAGIGSLVHIFWEHGIASTSLPGLRSAPPDAEEDIALEIMEVPSFPVALLDPLSGQFIQVMHDVTDAPETILWGAFLAHWSAWCQPYMTRHRQRHPALFLCNIGESRSARKSTSMYWAGQLFKDAERMAFSGEPIDPKQPMVVIKNFGSGEGFFDEMFQREGWATLLALDELGILVKKANIENSIGTRQLHDIYDGSSIRDGRTRKKDKDNPEPRVIESPNLAIFANSTDLSFRAIWTGAALDDGFKNRWLLTYGARTRYRLREGRPAPAAWDALVMRLSRTMRWVRANAPLEIDWTEAQIKMYEAFMTPELQGLNIETFVERYVQLRGAIEKAPTATDDIIAAALQLVLYQRDIRKAFPTVAGRTPLAQCENAILAFLEKHPGRMFTPRDLRNYANLNRQGFDTETIKRAVHNMAEQGIVRSEAKGLRLKIGL